MKQWLIILAFFSIQSAIANTDERRVALVIGNGDYKSISVLKNAANDARDISEKLDAMGFDVVTGTNLSKKEMREKISIFDKKIRAGAAEDTVALLFYAGHGLEVRGKNYLIPVDADMEFQEEVEYEGIALNKIKTRMERTKSRLNLIILDACRNNPLPSSSGRDASTGGWGASESYAKGTFIAYGTAPGRKAADSDGFGDNGLFTKHILQNIDEEGFTLEQVFKKVRDGVEKDSHGKQITWQNNSTTGDFFFKPGDARTLAIIIEKRPSWLIPVLVVGTGLILLTIGFQLKQRHQIAWAKSVVLSQELKKDNVILDDELQKSHLVRDQIVGYLKDLKENKIITLVRAGDNFLIGRDTPSDFIINDEVVSGRHCEMGFNPMNKTFWIRDLESSNGIWFSQEKQVQPNTKQVLKDGQVFYLANENHPLVLVKSNP